jgi:HEAT repeat protein
MLEQSARGALEALVVRDPDATVRRNAAWALGRLGNAGSRTALLQALTDPSGLVRGVAKAALAGLH